MKDRSYTPAQASAVANLPLKAVHKLIEGRLIRPKRLRVGQTVQRLISPEQVVYLRLESDGVRLLPMVTRRRVAKAIEDSPSSDVLVLSEGPALVVQVKAARQAVMHDLQRLKQAEEQIISDPEIMRGTPVYKGTRVPVDMVATMLEQGATVEEIVAGYPSLDAERVELATLYVRAFPRRGRPVSRPWAVKAPKQVSRQAVRKAQ